MAEIITNRTIESDMKESYLDYAMSVIIGRAIPDVRDGLKPVHRRILFAMHELGAVHGKPHKKSARIVGECFVKGTMVLTQRGLVPIQEIELGDVVITQHGKDRVVSLYEMPERRILRVKLQNGMNNSVTESQKFKVLTENLKFVWKEAKELRKGDYIVVKADYPDFEEPVFLGKYEGREIRLNENTAYMLGQLLSDGWIETGYNHGKEERCGFCSASSEVIGRIAGTFTDEFGYEPTIEMREKDMILADGMTRPSIIESVRIHRTGINRFLINNFSLHGAKANTKIIPPQILVSPRRVMRSFISGLIDGDGSVHKTRNVIHYGSISEKLIDQLQIILLHLGIFSRKYKNKKNAGGMINGKKVASHHEFFSLEISGRYAIELGKQLALSETAKKERISSNKRSFDPGVFESVPFAGKHVFEELARKHRGAGWYADASGRKFRAGIKYSKGSKIRYSKNLRKKMLTKSQITEWGILEKLERIGSPLHGFLIDVIKDKVCFLRVESVETAAPEKTYDIQVEGSHEFVANGMISHNCLGKYHPHGDMAVYDALIRMAQPFSLRYMLVDGQGNIGSVDGDSPAAMRYTEVRMARITSELLTDIDKGTVSYTDNFDGTLKEPTVMPSKVPTLLINGSSGIAVGMATNIPPHNLGEIVDATIAAIDGADEAELLKRVTGPDFPTGGIIVGRSGIIQAYKTGRGIIRVRSRIEKDQKKNTLVIKEIPYQVTKTAVIESIVEAVKNKRIEGISGVHDRSDKEGMEVVIDIKKGFDPDIVLNQLYAHTQVQGTFGIINLAIVGKQPKCLNLQQTISEFIEFRKEIVRKRCEFELKEARARAHILEGLKIAIENIDPIVAFLKAAKDMDAARTGLMEDYSLSELQANAVLDMKISRLVSLERAKIENEYQELMKKITWLEGVLSDIAKILRIIKDELLEIKEKYGDERRTEIVDDEGDVDIEDLIPNDDVVVVISGRGYVKRVGLDEYRTQHRGGKGVIGTETKEEDFVQDVIVTRNHNFLLLFTDKGRAFWLKAYRIPESSRYSTGKTLVSLLDLKDEKVTSWITVDKFDSGEYLSMVTKNGIIKRTALDNFSNVRKGGIIAITLKEKDRLVEVIKTEGKQDLIIATKKGQAIRFKEEEARELGRTGQGVIGIRFKEGEDEVVGIASCRKPALLTITENGYGKRTSIDEYRLQGRGGSGVINIKIEGRNGDVVGVRGADDSDEVIVMSSKGQAIRAYVKDISVIGRNTQGVRIIRLQEEEGETVASFAVLPSSGPKIGSEPGSPENVTPGDPGSSKPVEAQKENTVAPDNDVTPVKNSSAPKSDESEQGVEKSDNGPAG